MSRRLIRALVLLTGVAFVLSLAVVISAGLARWVDPPRWLVAVDLSLLVVLVLTGIVLWTQRGRAGQSGGREIAYGLMTYSPLLLLAVWLLFPHAVKWDVLLAGLAWRSFYFLLFFPIEFALWRKSAA